MRYFFYSYSKSQIIKKIQEMGKLNRFCPITNIEFVQQYKRPFLSLLDHFYFIKKNEFSYSI